MDRFRQSRPDDRKRRRLLRLRRHPRLGRDPRVPPTMMPLLPRRELAAWAAALLAAWALLAATGFTSRDPDSAFYAVMSARLANGPLAGVIAPEWGRSEERRVGKECGSRW